MRPEVDGAVRRAIAQLRLLEVTYENQARLVEPHDYGIQKGVEKIFCWQRKGGSGRGWRLFIASKVESARVLPESFAGSRPVSGKHLAWDELHASVSRVPFKKSKP